MSTLWVIKNTRFATFHLSAYTQRMKKIGRPLTPNRRAKCNVDDLLGSGECKFKVGIEGEDGYHWIRPTKRDIESFNIQRKEYQEANETVFTNILTGADEKGVKFVEVDK